MPGQTNEAHMVKFTAGRLFPLKRLTSVAVLAFAMILPMAFMASTASGEVATSQEMEQVCQNWLAQTVYEKGEWAGAQAPQVQATHTIYSGDTLLARWYDISPKGFVIVPTLKEMQPIKAYSDEYNLDESQEGGFLTMVRDMLSQRASLYGKRAGSLQAAQSTAAQPVFGEGGRKEWDRLSVSTKEFVSSLPLTQGTATSAGPLLTSSWDQGTPYNGYCPWGDGSRTVVGCVATAAAQIMNYWKWPESGYGSHTYTWGGDASCGNSTPAQDLTADFSDPYDWANMVDSCDGVCNSAQIAALAELCYEVGVAFDMDYGACGSGSYVTMAATVFPQYFKYSPDITLNYRTDFDLAGWFNLMKDEIDAGRVCDYRISSHSIVVDGYRDDFGKYEYHMNYGWGGPFTAWFVLDSLYCYWEPNDLCPASVEMCVTKIYPQTEPVLSCTGVTIADPDGNGNGIVEPGETFEITPTVKNMGVNAATIVTTMTTDDPYIYNDGIWPTSPVPSLDWGDQAPSTVPLDFQVLPTCPDPHVVTFEYFMGTDGGYSTVDTIQVFVGTTAGLESDVESGEGLWTHKSPNSQYVDQWHIDTYRKHSGSSSWKAGGSGPQDYSNSADCQLITPPFLLPSNAALTFWQWIAAEYGTDPGTAWDGATVYISSGDGNWTQLTPAGGYPYSIIDNPASPYDPGTPCWSGIHDWAQVNVDLSAYSGVVQLKFRFGSDGAATEEGWYIDDISVFGNGCCGIYTGGFTGNIDCDTEGKMNLADITALIDRVYLSKAPLCCEENGNVDGDPDGKLALADITKLIDHIYLSKQATAACQ